LSLPPCPPSLKSVAHFLKLASEHDARDPVVSYWARLTALQTGMTLDKSSKEALAVLLPLMDWLEAEKGRHADNDAVANEVAASAYIENYAMKLFLAADKLDRAANFGKNVVKMFYSSGVLFDIMESCFGELPPEEAHYRKYAKMKAAYIHNCLKNGETPVAGPLVGEEEEEDISIPVPQAPQAPQSQVHGEIGFAIPPQEPSYPQIPPQPQYPNAHTAPQGVSPVPVAPAPTPRRTVAPAPVAAPGQLPSLSMEQVSRAQKLCKFAISSLDYQDSKAAVENLNKALYLIQTGQEPQ